MAVDGLATDVHYTYDETNAFRDVRTLALTTGRDTLQMCFARSWGRDRILGAFLFGGNGRSALKKEFLR
jgi:hypothetical protein